MTHLRSKFFLVDRRVAKANLRVSASEAQRHFQLFQIGELKVAQRHIIVRHRLLLFYDYDVGFCALSHTTSCIGRVNEAHKKKESPFHHRVNTENLFFFTPLLYQQLLLITLASKPYQLYIFPAEAFGAVKHIFFVTLCRFLHIFPNSS